MNEIQDKRQSRGRLMIVEDMAVVAMDLENILQTLGYEVVAIADTGEEAMRLARELRPDLVLVDIKLASEVDGVETAEWMRTQLQIPVIFVTAYSDETTLQRAKTPEPLGYIVKPINKRELEANINLALYRHQMERALQESEARYAAMIQQSAECICLVDVDGRRLLEANPAMQQLLGYTAQEIEALTLYDVIDRQREEIDRSLQEFIKQRCSYQQERYRCKDGSLVEVEISASLIAYGNSQALCLIARKRH